MTVACVLRSGGIYGPEHVERLAEMVRAHLTNADFVCLTDAAFSGVDLVPLEHSFPGWWAKLELFRPSIFTGPVLYLDLDTVVVGEITSLASYGGDFAMISDFYRPDEAQSGVMAFRPGPISRMIWEAWLGDPHTHMRRFRGDGEWLHANFGKFADRLDRRFPGRIVSLKRDAKNGPPAGASIVCAHGRPKPWEPKAGWAFDLWNRQETTRPGGHQQASAA